MGHSLNLYTSASSEPVWTRAASTEVNCLDSCRPGGWGAHAAVYFSIYFCPWRAHKAVLHWTFPQFNASNFNRLETCARSHRVITVSWSLEESKTVFNTRKPNKWTHWRLMPKRAGGLGWTTSYSEAAELRALFTIGCMWEVLKAGFSWHGWDPLTHLEVEADANKHRAITGDHNRCTSADETDRTSTWNSSTEHQTNTSLAELNFQEAVLGFVWPHPQSAVFFNYSYKITRWEFIRLSNRDFEPQNQFPQLRISPIIQLVLFLLWPLSTI